MSKFIKFYFKTVSPVVVPLIEVDDFLSGYDKDEFNTDIKNIELVEMTVEEYEQLGEWNP